MSLDEMIPKRKPARKEHAPRPARSQVQTQMMGGSVGKPHSRPAASHRRVERGVISVDAERLARPSSSLPREGAPPARSQSAIQVANLHHEVSPEDLRVRQPGRAAPLMCPV